MNREHARRRHQAIIAKPLPASALQPAGKPFQGQQPGEEAEDHAHDARQEKMQRGTGTIQRVLLEQALGFLGDHRRRQHHRQRETEFLQFRFGQTEQQPGGNGRTGA